jgi:hypothetical protein
MIRSVIKLKGEELYIFSGDQDVYILFPTPSLFDEDEVGYILQDIEDQIDNNKYGDIEIIRTLLSTNKKREFAKFEDLEVKQAKIKFK